MLKAVTRQAAKVDAKIKQLNAAAAEAAADADESGARRSSRPPQTISTANFFDHHATPDDIAVMVTEEDFMAAHRELIPSVSAGELAHYERVRATFEGGRGGDEVESGGVGALKRPAALPLGMGSGGRRAASGTGSSGTRSFKGKQRATGTGKGKGKAVATGSDDDEDGYENDYGVEAGGQDDDDDEPGSGVNGSRDKGKGKAVAEFRDGTASDDEGMYDD